jgi:hypothetical protein
MNSFGCILSPVNFKSKNKIKKEYLLQIASVDFFLRNELSVYKLLQNSKYFYIFETVESITYNQLDENFTNDLSIPLNESNYILLRYPYKRLCSFREILESFIDNKSYSQYIKFIINSYKKMLYSINNLIENNIIHNNIYDSICVDENMETFIIQFGVSMHTSKYTIYYIKQYLPVYNPEYRHWPMEFHLLSYIITNKMESISKFNIKFIVEDVISRIKLDLHIKEKYIIEGIQYFNKYINKSVSYIVEDIFIYKSTWDNYSLSILFLDILSSWSSISNPFIDDFKQILIYNIHPNPKLRLTLNDTLNQFEKLCFETDILVFKEWIKVMY